MSRVNIAPAVKGYSSHRSRPISVGSLDFAQLVPTRVIECIKGDEFTKVHCSGYLRIAPTIFPAYGRLQLNSAAFFIPESQLIQQSDAFHDNMKTFKGRAVVLPKFHAYDINKFLSTGARVASPQYPFDISTSSVFSYRVGDDTHPSYEDPSITQLNEDLYDFVYPFLDGSTYKSGLFRLTHKGRDAYKILKALGYDFASLWVTNSSSESTILSNSQFFVSALPLLAYCKIYVDMFLNPHFYNSDLLVALLKSIHDCEDYSFAVSGSYTASTGVLDSNALGNIFGYLLKVPFAHNLYLDAWNSPNSPDGVSPASDMYDSNNVLDGVISPLLPQESTSYVERIKVDEKTASHGNVNSSGTATNTRTLSVYGLNWLQSFFQFARRNSLFGSKAFERLFARFGIKSSDYNSQFVNKIFEGKSDIDFSAVLSQTDSYNPQTDEGKTLGSYAGYGATGFQFEFSHKCDSFGYIICLSWLSIVPVKPTGFDPSVLRVHPLDFYTSEWDGKTIRAIPMAEIGRSKNPSVDNPDDTVYGYIDIYDDYREQNDSVFGDFVIDKNVKDFVFARDLGYFRFAPSKVQPQSDLVQYCRSNDTADMSNPFQFERNVADRFYLQQNFEIVAKRPILSKSSALDLNGEGDIDMRIGGSQMS